MIALFIAGFVLGALVAFWWDDWIERDLDRLQGKPR